MRLRGEAFSLTLEQLLRGAPAMPQGGLVRIVDQGYIYLRR